MKRSLILLLLLITSDVFASSYFRNTKMNNVQISSTAVVETCFDGILNQGETAIDCGGECTACPSCIDGILNQNETGIDCGGVCVACETCSDSLLNQDETGIDCGGVCTACPTCGNDIVEGTEVCDGLVLNGEDCVSRGYDAGTLACNANCFSFDVSGCTSSGGTPRLMPLGDSITKGSGDTVIPYMGYRDHLQNIQGYPSFQYDYVGSQTNNLSGVGTHDVNNEGHPGWASGHMNTYVDGFLDTSMPTPNPSGSIILYMIGANDAGVGTSDFKDFRERVQGSLDKIVAHDPTVKIYFANIPPRNDAEIEARVVDFNTRLEPYIITRQTLGQNFVRVDMHGAFVDDRFGRCGGDYITNCLRPDGVHPTDPGGYRTIADQWNSCIQSSTNPGCNGN